MAHVLGLRQLSTRDGGDERDDFIRHFIQIALAFQDAAGVHIHVFGHASIRVGIAGDLDDRGNRRSNDGPSARREQCEMRAARHELNDLRVVGDVRKAKLRRTVGHHVEQIQARRLG